MTVCSTTALRKYLTQHSNLGQPSREKAVSTTRAHAEGETIINSGRYRRPLFKSSLIHNLLYRTGTLAQCGAEHAYGPGCYAPQGCAAIVRALANEIDARAFDPSFPRTFP